MYVFWSSPARDISISKDLPGQSIPRRLHRFGICFPESPLNFSGSRSSKIYSLEFRNSKTETWTVARWSDMRRIFEFPRICRVSVQYGTVRYLVHASNELIGTKAEDRFFFCIIDYIDCLTKPNRYKRLLSKALSISSIITDTDADIIDLAKTAIDITDYNRYRYRYYRSSQSCNRYNRLQPIPIPILSIFLKL